MLNVIKSDVLDYAGDVEPKAAFDYLKNNSNSFLVDVRTQAEWAFVGVPDLSSVNSETIMLSWKVYPEMKINQGFVDQFLKLTAQRDIKEDSNIFFICKTGGRSLDAAVEITKNGYKNCFNVANGFEGDKTSKGHRGEINGWKASGLPWDQS